MHTDCTKTQAHTRKRKIDVWQGKEAKRKAEGRQRAERSGRKKKRVGNPAWSGEKKGKKGRRGCSAPLFYTYCMTRKLLCRVTHSVSTKETTISQNI